MSGFIEGRDPGDERDETPEVAGGEREALDAFVRQIVERTARYVSGYLDLDDDEDEDVVRHALADVPGIEAALGDAAALLSARPAPERHDRPEPVSEPEPRLLFKDWPRRDADQGVAILELDTTYPCTITPVTAPDGSYVYQVQPASAEPVDLEAFLIGAFERHERMTPVVGVQYEDDEGEARYLARQIAQHFGPLYASPPSERAPGAEPVATDRSPEWSAWWLLTRLDLWCNDEHKVSDEEMLRSRETIAEMAREASEWANRTNLWLASPPSERAPGAEPVAWRVRPKGRPWLDGHEGWKVVHADESPLALDPEYAHEYEAEPLYASPPSERAGERELRAALVRIAALDYTEAATNFAALEAHKIAMEALAASPAPSGGETR